VPHAAPRVADRADGRIRADLLRADPLRPPLGEGPRRRDFVHAGGAAYAPRWVFVTQEENFALPPLFRKLRFFVAGINSPSIFSFP
jgi:hypothetical protein